MFYGDWAAYVPEWVALELERVIGDYIERYMPPPAPSPFAGCCGFGGYDGFGGEFVGWSQPPRPADVIVSFNPHASRQEQARAVLYDYYHDDPLRYWSDNEAVKRCFIGGSDPRKENHDPLLLIAAYENPKHKLWKCTGTGMSWKEMNDAVQQAIAHRKKLGPLPKSSYDTNPIVIYYYDNDKMKRITYPLSSVPQALDPHNFRWWAPAIGGDGSDAGKAAGLDDVHTREADDPKKIAVERAHPGWTKDKDNTGSAGGWTNEQFTWDKDVAGTGVIGSITGAILALVSAVLDATGIGAVVGVPLGIATPFIVAAINATDTALHAGDFGAALANLGPALAQAAISAAGKGAGAAGISIPPAAMKALGGTVTAISKDIAAGQNKKLDFGQVWTAAAAKAKSYSKIGDAEAESIATVLGGPGGQSGTAGHVFVQGYLAGKFLDQKALGGIAKILQAWTVFGDSRIINIALLGMGIGYVSQKQHAGLLSSASTRGEFAGQIIFGSPRDDARYDLAQFAHFYLAPRYGIGPNQTGEMTGFEVFEGFDEMVGFVCPEGYDPVIGSTQLACAYRAKAACLNGYTNEFGKFTCSDWDYPPCPPGMVNMSGSPKNWCFPVSGSHAVGGDTPDYSFPALGCPHGQWWDSLTGTCRPAPPLPPRTGFGFW
jgi:hypothetical protein